VARSYRYLHLDVFTARPFGGNQLAVFTDGRGLAAAEMQAIAREMNFSESTFVLPPRHADCDAHVRIFTPAEELPMAGHPTVGTAFALARSGVLDPGRERVVFELGVGPTPVDLRWNADSLGFAWMTQLLPTFSDAPLDREALASSLGLPAPALHARLPVQVVSCGVPYLLVPLGTRAEVDAATLDRASYDRCLAAAGLGRLAVFLFSLEPGGADRPTAYSRMFAPGLGITEDPATGSASGPLGCYLVMQGVVEPANAATIMSLQGVAMGRPSVIHIAISTAGRAITGVKVGGEAVLAGEGTLYV
jgi:trans-2,3-dihydro-3-hydroxyanthranilate isomerase